MIRVARCLPRFVALLLWALVAACSRGTTEEHHEPVEPTARVAWGTVMSDVARRFELLGRAATAGRFELAEYELGEIEEQFEDTLPHAIPPREGHPEVLPALASAFLKSSVPDLETALKSKDPAQLDAAFERTAKTCNACHQASGHGFIEVPLSPGHSVPNTDPIAR